MQHFQRRLEHLDSFLGRRAPAWWVDLLSLWRPSGQPSGRDGLRLAIRNNYLNFYRLGQSVARVEILAGGKLTASFHHKYLNPAATGQEYVVLAEDGSVRGKASKAQYSGLDMLRGWIKAAERHAGTEKRRVDELVAVNESVIDLEMGLPGTEVRRYAPRMDLVALEAGNERVQVVFWEAKMVGDSRIRSRSSPEVLAQLNEYREFLAEDVESGRNAVATAYRNAAVILNKLAAANGSPFPADSLISRVVHTTAALEVDSLPRLVVIKDDQARNEVAWASHEDKLRGDLGSRLKVIEHLGPYSLGSGA